LNTCAHFFNVVATIIQVRDIIILCVKILRSTEDDLSSSLSSIARLIEEDLSSSFSCLEESVVPPSSEQAHWAGSSSEETSSDEEESSSLSSSLSSPNVHRYFDVIVDISSSSLAYLHLFSLEAIWDSSVEWTRVWSHWYIWSPRWALQEARATAQWRVVGEHFQEACATVHARRLNSQ
jgi:hypothetical protein